MSSNIEIVKKVCFENYHPPRPTLINCPDDIWNLMLTCWNFFPDRRPDFEVISKKVAIPTVQNPGPGKSEYRRTPLPRASPQPQAQLPQLQIQPQVQIQMQSPPINRSEYRKTPGILPNITLQVPPQDDEYH